MRIIDEKNWKSLDSILIMLTPQEAAELASKLTSLDASIGDHHHIPDIDFKREVTVAIYTPENLRYFREEVRKILTEE